MMNSTIETALLIAGIGMTGIFVFMTIFYLLIVWLDKALPHKESKMTTQREESEEVAGE